MLMHAHSVNPQISVIVPTRNEGLWLQKTIDSINGVRSDISYEILVIDDGCTDGSMKSIADRPHVKVTAFSNESIGLISSKRSAVSISRGDYLCFLDSHILVSDYWLDYLHETCERFDRGALVSANLRDAASLTNNENSSPSWVKHAYTLTNRSMNAGWFNHLCDPDYRPYQQPLTPGGLMFAYKPYFESLGNFAPLLRKWGAEDIEISLRNYCFGGENISDPRILAYHYYKPQGSNRWVSREQYVFNCLYVARIYFSQKYYLCIRDSMLPHRGYVLRLMQEIESLAIRRTARDLQRKFVRRFDDWGAQFSSELAGFVKDIESYITQHPKQDRNRLFQFAARALSRHETEV